MRMFSLCLLSCFAAGAAQAQTRVSFGPRVGGNLSSATFNALNQASGGGSSLSLSRSSLPGVQVGMGASIGSGPWTLQPALMFSQKGLKQTATASESFAGETVTLDLRVTSRINYLELPVNVVYTLGADGQGVQLFAGPYVAVGVGGKADYTEKITSTNPTSFFNLEASGSQGYAFGNTFAEPDPNGANTVDVDARARRLDAGFNAGVGYRTGPFQAQLGYAFGLRNAQPDYPASYRLANTTGYHRSVQLVATYFLPARSGR